MEAFSLLKYWRSSGAATSHATNVIKQSEITETDEEINSDDGPFFDMEFTVDGDEKPKNRENVSNFFDNIQEESDDELDDCDCENEEELKFTLSSASSGDSIDPNISLSPSDDLFFKGRLVPLTEPTDTYADTSISTKPASKSQKFRVLMLKLKKSTKLSAVKGAENEENVVKEVKYFPDREDSKQQVKSSAKFYSVKFKVEEVPVLSMFTRDNSSKVANSKTNKESVEKSTIIEEEERVFSKDMVNKYLKKVKPLYVRVSKRYGEKLGFSGHLSLAGAMKAGTGTPKVSESNQVRNVKSLKQGISFPGKLRVVRKQLGKSKSASSTVTAAVESPPVVMVAKRRDDSLLQQQDGIQSAIMHCKRSFKGSREPEGDMQ